MATSVMFLDCPALEAAKIRCPRDHWFNAPIASLTWEKGRHPADRGSVRDRRR